MGRNKRFKRATRDLSVNFSTLRITFKFQILRIFQVDLTIARSFTTAIWEDGLIANIERKQGCIALYEGSVPIASETE